MAKNTSPSVVTAPSSPQLLVYASPAEARHAHASVLFGQMQQMMDVCQWDVALKLAKDIVALWEQHVEDQQKQQEGRDGAGGPTEEDYRLLYDALMDEVHVRQKYGVGYHVTMRRSVMVMRKRAQVKHSAEAAYELARALGVLAQELMDFDDPANDNGKSEKLIREIVQLAQSEQLSGPACAPWRDELLGAASFIETVIAKLRDPVQRPDLLRKIRSNISGNNSHHGSSLQQQQHSPQHSQHDVEIIGASGSSSIPFLDERHHKQQHKQQQQQQYQSYTIQKEQDGIRSAISMAVIALAILSMAYTWASNNLSLR